MLWIIHVAMTLPLGFIGLCVAADFRLLPFVSERMAMALPPETDVQLGDPMFEGMKADLAIRRSTALQAFSVVG